LGLGRNHEAVRDARQYLELCDAISGSDAARFWGQLGTSEILRFSGDPELAGTIKRELVDALEAGSDLSLGALPSRPKLAPLLTDLAAIELDLGRLESARAFAARGLEQRRRDGVGKGVAHALNTVAAVEIASENFRLAREHHAEALALMAAEGSPEVVDHQLGLAEAEMLLGDVQAARGWLREALGSPLLVQDVGHGRFTLDLAAWIAAVLDEHDVAARLVGASQSVLDATGMSVDPHEKGRRERLAVELRKALGPGQFSRVHEAGHALDLAGALELIRSTVAASP
jgi:tetratricopeptide (TPR) repeat protein